MSRVVIEVVSRLGDGCATGTKHVDLNELFTNVCGRRTYSVGGSVTSCQVSDLAALRRKEGHEHMESVRYCDVDSRGSCWFGSRENVELAIVTRTYHPVGFGGDFYFVCEVVVSLPLKIEE